MYFNLKPVKLIKGHNYRIGYTSETKTVYKLIKATAKGYKFLNLKTFTCGRQHLLYPSKEAHDNENYELWFWLPKNLFITEVPLAEMEITYCDKCVQMTNHRDGMCQKCISKETQSVPDFYEEVEKHES
jgi:hypothetical protein